MLLRVLGSSPGRRAEDLPGGGGGGGQGGAAGMWFIRYFLKSIKNEKLANFRKFYWLRQELRESLCLSVHPGQSSLKHLIFIFLS